jgi:hypothetical protein
VRPDIVADGDNLVDDNARSQALCSDFSKNRDAAEIIRPAVASGAQIAR